MNKCDNKARKVQQEQQYLNVDIETKYLSHNYEVAGLTLFFLCLIFVRVQAQTHTHTHPFCTYVNT